MPSLRKPLSNEQLAAVTGGSGSGDPERYLLDQMTAAEQQMKDQLGDAVQQYYDLTHLNGTAGNDFLMGTSHDTEFRGGGGEDFMFGGAGDDTFFANDGDRASDFVMGGAGDDTYVWSPGSGSDAFFGQEGQDSVRIHGMSIDQLRMAFVPEAPGQSWRITMFADAFVITCELPGGAPRSFNGNVNFGGETLMMNGVERLVIPR